MRLNGQSVLNYGDMSVLSFHATKVLTPLRGGLSSVATPLPSNESTFREFRFADEVTVVAPGINGKMNEVQAAFGMFQPSTLARLRIGDAQSIAAIAKACRVLRESISLLCGGGRQNYHTFRSLSVSSLCGPRRPLP